MPHGKNNAHIGRKSCREQDPYWKRPARNLIVCFPVMTDSTTSQTHSSSDIPDPLRAAAGWRADGTRVALATVVETWGSSPCPAGSQLAVCESSAFVGSVSGGCVETAVVESALEVIRSGEPCLLEFGVSDEMAWEVGLACGGRIRVYVEPVE